MYKLIVISIFIFSIIFPVLNTSANNKQIKIIYFTNQPEITKNKKFGGLAELATLLNQTRAENEHTLFLHGGDSFGPSTLSSMDRGSHMVDLLNFLEPDVMGVSQRELSYKEDELTLRASEASFPLVSANIFDPLIKGNLEGLQNWQMYEIGDYKIGITSIISAEVASNYQPKRIQVWDATNSIKNAVKEMKTQGADLIILLSDYAPPEKEAWLASGLVDIIFVNIEDKADMLRNYQKGYIAKKGRVDGTALEINITLDGQGASLKTHYEGRSIVLSEFPADPEMQEQIDGYLDSLASLLDIQIGTFGSDVTTKRNLVRTQETAFGNLISDAFRETTNADIAIFNGGGIRGNRDYKAGHAITRGDIQSELPFRNTIMLMKIKGSQLKPALENGFSLIEDVKGRFPQISGMKVTIKPTAPAGQRVLSIEIAGKPVIEDAYYSLVTTDFMGNGGDGYEQLKSGERIYENVGALISGDVVANYILKQQTVSPVIEGRIVQVD